MQSKEILEWCFLNLKGCILIDSYGEQCIFYNPDHVLKRGIYVLTIKDKDGPNDTASNLNREDIFRVNMGLRKETFVALFNKLPVRPKASNVVSMDYNFSELNQILPHPVYAWMGVDFYIKSRIFRTNNSLYRRILCLCKRKIYQKEQKRKL